MHEDEKRQLAEGLWQEINRAVVTNSEVQKRLESLKRLDLLEYLAQFDYVIDGRILIENTMRELTPHGPPNSPSPITKH